MIFMILALAACAHARPSKPLPPARWIPFVSLCQSPVELVLGSRSTWIKGDVQTDTLEDLRDGDEVRIRLPDAPDRPIVITIDATVDRIKILPSFRSGHCDVLVSRAVH
jgi:hypothetical protein